MSHIAQYVWTFCPQLVEMFEKSAEHLGDGVFLEDVRYEERGLEFYGLAPLHVHFLLPDFWCSVASWPPASATMPSPPWWLYPLNLSGKINPSLTGFGQVSCCSNEENTYYYTYPVESWSEVLRTLKPEGSTHAHLQPGDEDDVHFRDSSAGGWLCTNTLELPSSATMLGILYWFWSVVSLLVYLTLNCGVSGSAPHT